MINNVLVSICCLVYNHAPYIRQCLYGFMMQKTNFSFEVLIHDDASTDGTANIIREYVAKYPEIIKPIYQTDNQYSKVNGVSVTYQFPRAKGKYIALCEGDDYWIDPCKLQNQVDFLENNPEYSICGGLYKLYMEDEERMIEMNSIQSFMKNYSTGVTVTLDNFLDPYLLRTATVCFRKESINQLSSFKKVFDVALFAVALENGKGFIFNEFFSVYRRHQGGVWSGLNYEQRILFDLQHFDELKKRFRGRSISIKQFVEKRRVDLLFYNYKVYREYYADRELLDIILFLLLPFRIKRIKNRTIIKLYVKIRLSFLKKYFRQTKTN